MTILWCLECGTAHGRPSDCPGPLGPTGAERAGRIVHVETPGGIESVGVLVAPARDGWRARVITYPNIIWSVPGGSTSMKFFARTEREAENLAAAFVDEHCRRRRWTRRNELQEAPDPVGAARTTPASQRKPRALPLRFGVRRLDRQGITVNLSATGLFVATADPLEPGTAALLRIELDSAPVPLDGSVVWRRRTREPGRLLGMGIRLDSPPAPYVRFWQALP